MYCNKCGGQIAEGQSFCTNCGNPLGVKPVQMGGAGYAQYAPVKKIDNIFSAIAHVRRAGDIWEFALWCVVCVIAILFLVAMILVSDSCPAEGGFRATWIFMMLFALGLGVIMAFRLKPWVIICGSGVFSVLLLIIYYAVTTTLMKRYAGHVPGFVIALFILELLTALGLTTCCLLHFVTRFNLGKVCAILSFCVAGLMLLLIICIYVVPSYEYDYDVFYEYKSNLYNTGAYWPGSISYFLTQVVLTVYTALFFFRVFEIKKEKLISGYDSFAAPVGSSVVNRGGTDTGVQCIRGAFPGQVMYLQGREIVIGSGTGVDYLLRDPYVSGRHCSLRFNLGKGLYEIMDMSTNGTYFSNGSRLPKNVYQQCPRGTIIFLGSQGQQYRLL